MDAPEADQTCESESGPIATFGPAATAVLDALLRDLDTCELMETDRFGRMVACCYTIDGQDIGAAMVAAGVAWDYPEFSGGYYADREASARTDGLGNWSMECIPPWEWREGN